MRKIFGIGLSRTGTTSLSEALRVLGYRVQQFPRSMTEIEANDALTDTVVGAGFPLLDMMYPGSAFIYTQRDIEPWLDSCERFFSVRPATEFTAKVRMAIYGRTTFDRETFRQVKLSYEQRVMEYFAGRELLVLRVAHGEGWEKLCPFLDKPMPDVPFPFENRSGARGGAVLRLE